MTDYADLPLTVKENPRARRVLVKLVPGRGLEVVIPKGFGKRNVPAILAEKRAWIERTRDAMTARGIDLSDTPPEPPERIDHRACGRAYRVGYLDRPGRITVTENGPRLIVRGPLAEKVAVLEALRKHTVKKTREFALPLLEDMSRELGMPYAALRVRHQRTRWGSCSAKGTISLNAKLLFLPPELVDHLLLHELCHTVFLNHSPRYWALVAKHQPDYARLEKELSQGGKYVPAWFK